MGGASEVNDHLTGIDYIKDADIEDVGKNVKEAAIKARKTEIRTYYDREIRDAEGDGITQTDDTSTIRQLESEREEALENAESEFDHIPELFTVFNEPSPIYTMTIRDHLSDVRGTLTSAATEKVDSVETLVADWTGTAAMQFQQGFLNPFPKSVDNQVEVVDEMYAAVGGFEAILLHSRKDVKDIGNKTVKVLDSLYAWKSDNLTPALGIITAVAGVLGAIPTGGATLTLAIIGGTAAVTSSAAALEISGGSVDDILQKMNDNLDQVRSGMTDNENGLQEALDSSYGEVSGIVNSSNNEEQRDLVPNRPNVADGDTDREDFEVPPEVK